jgi:maltooligosyltrehalose trehalohydrolase
VLSTGERDGYSACFQPKVEELARAIERGWLYEGQTWPLTGEPRGERAEALPAPSFVYAIQNHDQVGNRALGDRLFGGARGDRLAALTMLLLFQPATPLLFMGQEWGASTPFLYFSDHEPALGAKVTEGRRAEFRHFEAFAAPGADAEVPDPQADDTFLRSKLDWSERESAAGRQVLAVVRRMLALRHADPVLAGGGREQLRAEAHGDLLVVTRTARGPVAGPRSPRRVLVVHFGEAPASIPEPVVPRGAEVLLTSAPGAWREGTLSPGAAALFDACDRVPGRPS